MKVCPFQQYFRVLLAYRYKLPSPLSFSGFEFQRPQYMRTLIAIVAERHSDAYHSILFNIIPHYTRHTKLTTENAFQKCLPPFSVPIFPHFPHNSPLLSAREWKSGKVKKWKMCQTTHRWGDICVTSRGPHIYLLRYI